MSIDTFISKNVSDPCFLGSSLNSIKVNKNIWVDGIPYKYHHHKVLPKFDESYDKIIGKIIIVWLEKNSSSKAVQSRVA